MTTQNTSGGRKTRHGTCHRCGWHGQVAKLARRERRALSGDRTLVRLCNDCINDLLHVQPSASPQVQASQLRSVGNRHVA